ncbi:Rhodanese-related sulfurtransferase [Ekhidna lutea]|uniref:Rhodanese-related sulfurtransferase n=1 Tax=Ekhidna lutea TaxID=447679 RepID=A0A239KF05_EKHLU|nr:rhodanese-like domain-containing protein [Ekhidna lutea]SNT16278.1 Rhodanese-related sulfurtransferase [Ekhidna lutea]
MKKLIPPFILLLISTITSCGQKTFDEKMESLYKKTVPLIKADSLKPKLAGVVILDTRSEEEYQVSHINGARFVDYDNFEVGQVSNISKDTEVIVYCSVGYRSERVGEKLQKAGYTNVKNLYGGIFGWKNEGFEVVGMNNLPTDSVHVYNRLWGRWLFKGTKVY